MILPSIQIFFCEKYHLSKFQKLRLANNLNLYSLLVKRQIDNPSPQSNEMRELRNHIRNIKASILTRYEPQ